MKRLPRKIRRKLQKLPFAHAIALITIVNIIIPQHTAIAAESVDVLPQIPSVVMRQALTQARLDLGTLPQMADVPVKRTMRLTVTAYSSTVDQTDGDPFTAASGARVFDGMLAHNTLPFGTKVRIPEYFGDKVFIVLDRLNPRYGQYMADIWMETREQAKQWGARIVTIEILD
ncbi:MAG: hypothetical protein WCV86_02195 [Patescibacteria group bacterium]|jgi:3D (Asp-Asp-Asp) domain-containing protein